MTLTGYSGFAGVSPALRLVSQRRRAEELPAVALQNVGPFLLGHHREAALGPMLLLDEPARLGRGVEEQHPPGFRAGVLPGMRHAARHEGAGPGAADRNLVADLEGDLALQDVGHLVAVVVQMEGALGPGWDGFLEHHDAVAGRAAEQL